MQLLSSSAGEKDRKKLVGDPDNASSGTDPLSITSPLAHLPLFLHAGIDQRDGSDATDGIQTHQLRQSQDDDDAAYGPEIPGGLPSALLPVSAHTPSPGSQQVKGDIWKLTLSLLYCVYLRIPTS